MKEYTFTNMAELKSFIEASKGDDKAHYFWGFIENYDGELYTIEDLENDISESWFDSDNSISSVYEFEEEDITEEEN